MLLYISGETTEQRIFQKRLLDLERLVDPSQLYPVLYNRDILTTDQVEDLRLEVVGNTPKRKVERLLEWLPRSSSRFLDRLIECLRETESRGHQELADLLEADLWPPLSPQHCHYEGATSSILTLCSLRGEHEGVYRCRVLTVRESLYCLNPTW